jgi:hypothetical protein
MTETLRTSEEIVLFGRVVSDVAVTAMVPPASGTGDPQLTINKAKKIARIYGWSYDGTYYEMLGPVLFIVDGDGKDAEDVPVVGPNPKFEKFVESLRAWTVNKDDETFRMDVDSGKYEDILLADVGDGNGGGMSGARVSGARVAGARVSGARVSGARVSGARVSGARVSGARVSGARIDGD